MVDHSFCGIGVETAQLAPDKAMKFGHALEQILQKIRHADPHHGPVCLSKVDLADGFCQFGLALSGISELAIVFPACRDKKQINSFPLVRLRMWL